MSSMVLCNMWSITVLYISSACVTCPGMKRNTSAHLHLCTSQLASPSSSHQLQGWGHNKGGAGHVGTPRQFILKELTRGLSSGIKLRMDVDFVGDP